MLVSVWLLFGKVTISVYLSTVTISLLYRFQLFQRLRRTPILILRSLGQSHRFIMSNIFPRFILQTFYHRDFILVRMIGLLKWKIPLEPLCSKSRLEEFILSNLFPSNVLRIIKKTFETWYNYREQKTHNPFAPHFKLLPVVSK